MLEIRTNTGDTTHWKVDYTWPNESDSFNAFYFKIDASNDDDNDDE